MGTNLRTANTEPPPPSGKFNSRSELERRIREYEEEAGRALARAKSIKDALKRTWGDE
jgi:hypothetical protein